MTTATALASEKYVALTTYKKDGTPVSSPVWIADLGEGKIGFTTASSSWKIKRLRNNDAILLQPSNSKGKVLDGSSASEGTAVGVTGAEFDAAYAAIKSKYGFQFAIIRAVGAIAKLLKKGSGTDTAVVITLND